MEQRETQGLLLSLLEDSGVPFQNEQGLVRFRFRQQGMVWETACRCQKDQVVAYGSYPFPVEKGKALGLCNQFNQQLAQGSFFEQQGQVVYRNRADLQDPYDARQRLAGCLEQNAGVIVRYWGGFSQAAQQQ